MNVELLTICKRSKQEYEATSRITHLKLKQSFSNDEMN